MKPKQGPSSFRCIRGRATLRTDDACSLFTSAIWGVAGKQHLRISALGDHCRSVVEAYHGCSAGYWTHEAWKQRLSVGPCEHDLELNDASGCTPGSEGG